MTPRLAAIPELKVTEDAPLREHTRFGIGGPARLLVDACSEGALAAGLRRLRETGMPHVVIGGGSNLIAADEGFDGAVVRYAASSIEIDGEVVRVAAGTVLQNLVDASIAAGLAGLHTMTRIPGWVGGAIYGNAGAYGHSVHEFVESVRFLDLESGGIEEIDNQGCRFAYRESVFKKNKDWVVLEAALRLARAGSVRETYATATEIARIRDEKYPPEMRCAGSIFKNLILAELPPEVRQQVPERVIREGKVPSAYFLEAVGAKGMTEGGIKVADYHANLIYNQGGGTSRQVCRIIGELKRRVRERFGLELEEEVQHVGPVV